MVNKIR